MTLTTLEAADWTTLTGHVVVCGLHDDGLRFVEQLHRAGIVVIVVDDTPDTRLIARLDKLEVPLLREEIERTLTLRRAGIDGAMAVVCAERDDLQTLATALMARELRPDVRVVCQVHNPALGRALDQVGVAVLDAAELAAPSVVEACLMESVHRVQVDGRTYVVVETIAQRSGTLRELYGDLAPLAVEGPGPGEVRISPGRDEVVSAGSTVALVGSEAQLAGAVAIPAPVVPGDAVGGFVGARAPRAETHRPVALVRYVTQNLDRRFKVAFAALAGLVLVSVSVLLAEYRGPDGSRMNIVDALYFTIETVGTVGFGDFYFRDQATWLRVWAIMLMIVGATLAATFLALLTNALVSRTLSSTLGARAVTGARDHVVVVGAGSVGIVVTAQLRAAGVPVVVVEADEHNQFLAGLRTQGAMVVVADATLPETWETVRISTARAVAVMTSDDLVNIETGLAVRDSLGVRWAEVPVVVRLFDRRLARTIVRSFDFHFVRSPSALAAPWFVGAALGLDVVKTLYVAGQPMLVARLGVSSDSGLVGTQMADLDVSTRVVSLTRADTTVVDLPRRDVQLKAGDRVTVIGPYEELLRLLRA